MMRTTSPDRNTRRLVAERKELAQHAQRHHGQEHRSVLRVRAGGKKYRDGSFYTPG